MKKVFLLLFISVSCALWSQQWTPLGPDGGDVRSLSRDPYAADRILLSTSAGQIYESTNGGLNWSRFTKLGEGNDYVLDTIIFHPTQAGLIYVAAWSVENSGGDVFRSLDNGKTWKPLKEMHGKSVRAFAMAPSNPEVLVAGALDGVFRSKDGGEHWSLISPANHPDIRNIESLAIDPLNPDAIYAGTWHLPWKTSDGGATWKNIKSGIIDDSDVFSIIIDQKNPSVVYASACSGIYKSESSGEAFHKVQGIPYSARRTRVLRQDPADRDTVYAGTTEGLWKTIDAGKSWKRMTGPNVIVNAVLIDPAHPSRVLLATDRGGVLSSTNGGISFTVTNHGFSHRQVATVVIDKNDSSTLYAGLINDKEFGGVFISKNSGQSWQQMNVGLNGHDVFILRQSGTGELVAGTNRGIFALRTSAATRTSRWTPLDTIMNVEEVSPSAARVVKSKKGARQKSQAPTRKYLRGVLSTRINNLELTPRKWFAATATGLYSSNDEGKSWHGGPVHGESDFVDVHASANTVVAAARKALFVSDDDGITWHKTRLPENVTGIAGVTMDDSSNLFIASREGAYKSADGEKWEYLSRLPVNNIGSIVFDEETHRLIATSTTSTEMFESKDSGRKWQRIDSGWPLRSVRSSRGRVVGTTAFDGVVAQPDSTAAVTGNGGPGSAR